MGIEVALGAAAVGAIVQADQGRRAAQAQGDIANAQLQQQESDRALASQYAEPSLMELEQLQRSIQLNEQDIQRKEKLLASADPALIEAGEQALKLLRGEEAKALDPLRRQQAKDREKLKDTLRAQLGTGFENTSAGIQALAAFDEASQNAQFGAQNQTLAQLLGVAQNVQGLASVQSNIANASGLSSQRGAINQRRVNAILGTPITGAGAQYVGGLQDARNNMQLGQNLTNLGTLAALYGGGGPSSPQQPSGDVFALNTRGASPTAARTA